MSKNEVIKHSSTIQVTNTISLLQRRAWNVMLANAYDELPAKDEYEIDLSDLQKELGFNSKNEDYLQEILISLMKCVVEWNILDKDGEEWAAMPIIGQVKIKGNKLYYSYAPELRRKLYNPRMYARISLSMQNKFNSKYSLALYELFIDYYDAKRAYGETPWIEIDQYRLLMGVEEGEYSEFKELKRRTITRSLEEINEKSDILVEDVYRTVGRKVTGIKFKIRRKPEALLLPAGETEEVDLFNADVVEQLQAFGVSHGKAVAISKQCSHELIKNWVKCMSGDFVKNVNSKPGYLVAALEGGFDLPPAFVAMNKTKSIASQQKERDEHRKNCPICKGEGGYSREVIIDGFPYTFWKDCECMK